MIRAVRAVQRSVAVKVPEKRYGAEPLIVGDIGASRFAVGDSRFGGKCECGLPGEKKQ
jgi:hypothetical protein